MKCEACGKQLSLPKTGIYVCDCGWRETHCRHPLFSSNGVYDDDCGECPGDHGIPERVRWHVLGFFKGDSKKTNLWFSTPNPLLGNVSPQQMISMGREYKLLKWVRQQLAENEPPAGISQ